MDNEHRDSIFTFVKERHPEIKYMSAKFKRKASEYGREIVMYKNTFNEYMDKTTAELIELLYK